MTIWTMAWALALGLNLAVILCVIELALLGVLSGFLQAAQRGREWTAQTARPATPLRSAPPRATERPSA